MCNYIKECKIAYCMKLNVKIEYQTGYEDKSEAFIISNLFIVLHLSHYICHTKFVTFHSSDYLCQIVVVTFHLLHCICHIVFVTLNVNFSTLTPTSTHPTERVEKTTF